MVEVKKHGGRRPGAGRKSKPLTAHKRQKDGRIVVRIDPATQTIINADVETQALAMRLMLNYPDVRTVQDVWSYAIHRLAET